VEEQRRRVRPILGPIKAWLDRTFVDREVILRSQDRIKYLRIGGRLQLCVAASAAAGSAWLLYATLAFFLSGYMVKAKDAEIAEHRLAYFDLLSEVSEYQGHFAKITRNLQSNQDFLLGLLNSDDGVAGRIAGNLKSSDNEYARVAVARDALRDRLEAFEGELQDIALRNSDLHEKVATLQEALQWTEQERLAVTAARERLGQRLQETEQELALASASKSELESTVRTLLAELTASETAARDLAALRDEENRSYIAERDRLVSESEAERIRLETELSTQRAELEARIAAQREQLQAEIVTQREQLQAEIVTQREELEGELIALRDRLHTDNAAQRKALEAEIAMLERELDDSSDRETGLERQVGVLEGALSRALDRGAELAATRDSLEQEKSDLEGLIVDIRDQQKELVDRVNTHTVDSISDLETLVASTGLDVENLLGQVDGFGNAQGGPFIPADDLLSADTAYELKVSVAMMELRLNRWDALQQLVTHLPLAAPLEHYEINSDFGYRRDPINGRSALHSGIDFGAPRNTPLYTTAPGVVSFAGWRGRYGRVVEIDHGFGIKTRYAHMAKISVKKGEEVGVGVEVGLLGSSGRATGPHLHYEILFDGDPIDPMNFIKAGQNVF